MKDKIYYFDAFLSKTNPGIDAPKVEDTRLAKIVANIMVGIDVCLNQLTAILIGVLIMKIVPKAAKQEPTKHHSGFP